MAPSDSKDGGREKEKPASEDGFNSDLLQQAGKQQTSVHSKEGTIVNASGHQDQLARQYGLL